MRDLDKVFDALQGSAFRMKFKLDARDRAYLDEKGLHTIRQHADDFIAARLASAAPKNDGKQTPWRGHPVFVAQHATATCCRSCLARWHGIEKGRTLSEREQRHIADAIERWLAMQN